ncbi:hypothetical protein, partial [Aromatoleum anaerobium]|uniref:hypothetical protein n=1 Tax=Aromatoleum anaerobium TaxID=182180 RepID=UPI001FF5E07E
CSFMRSPLIRGPGWLEKSRYSLLRGDCESAHRYLDLGSNPRIWRHHTGFHLFANELEDPDIAVARFHIVSGGASQAVPQLISLYTTLPHQSAGRNNR